MSDERGNAARLDALSAGPDAPEVVRVIVEVPRGSGNKYEYDHDLGVLRLDRVLFAAMRYPGDYGFIPGTLSEDGDPLDALVLSTAPLLPGVLVEVRVIGLLEMTDDKGRDAKVLAVVRSDPRLTSVVELEDVAAHTLTEVEHFFLEYKTLEGKAVLSEGWHDRQAALDEIRRAVARSNERA